MDKFIYVFTKDAKEELLKRGFQLLKDDEYNKVFVFENNSLLTFDNFDFSYIYSDTLTF